MFAEPPLLISRDHSTAKDTLWEDLVNSTPDQRKRYGALSYHLKMVNESTYADIRARFGGEGSSQSFRDTEDLIDEKTKLLAIYYTNNVRLNKAAEELVTGVFELYSRINHSCDPNAEAQYDTSRGELQVVALRKIEKGEELTVAYIDCSLGREQRRKRLKQWGFNCTCARCRTQRP